ncbi:MetQ/NlpA family ABC transporter substrate-binding protein [Fructilactobacillus hinvesii]|uniref:Lipoprotein n=1 Tax=Fructilactobacillus hinvesii TaxID=2940300 RepID=A0ABY5BRQ9_9LACO|nr:MetQ/NlpA family ABC transporter substrate-binding protein [Fructilactobacillus hinvesii]USS87335.1 MetQ/NlpA family ABC transporter substrate-binding protein [Fructilactobacillus hinvesii]
MTKTTRRLVWLGILIFILVMGYFSFFRGTSEQKNTINVGIMAGSKAEQQIWDSVAQTAKQKYGLTVKFQRFTDYSQPNTALANHSIDVNAFQNYPFLDLWNQKHHDHIVAVGDTIIEPMRIYSHQTKRVADLPNGSTVTVPNDANNESRALFVLQSAGLLKLKPNTKLADARSIIANPRNLQIKEVDASQTARSLNDAGAAVVNGNYAQAASLDPHQAIFTEPFDHHSKQWINFIAANRTDRNDPRIKKLVKAYQTKKTAAKIKQVSGINQVPAWNLNLK